MVTQLWSHASLGCYNLYKQYFQSIIKLTKTWDVSKQVKSIMIFLKIIMNLI